MRQISTLLKSFTNSIQFFACRLPLLATIGRSIQPVQSSTTHFLLKDCKRIPSVAAVFSVPIVGSGSGLGLAFLDHVEAQDVLEHLVACLRIAALHPARQRAVRILSAGYAHHVASAGRRRQMPPDISSFIRQDDRHGMCSFCRASCAGGVWHLLAMEFCESIDLLQNVANMGAGAGPPRSTIFRHGARRTDKWPHVVAVRSMRSGTGLSRLRDKRRPSERRTAHGIALVLR